MRTLVTGTEGYIGSLLPPLLVERGHEVVGVDTGFYADARLYDLPDPPMRRVREDIRRLGLQTFGAVPHFDGDDVGALKARLRAAHR